MDPNLPLAHETPHLMTLPQELQDMIFQAAYTGAEKITVTSSIMWPLAERRKKEARPDYAPRPWPGPKVNDFMVSKEFFANAANAYMGASTFRPRRCTIFDITNAGIGRVWVQSVETEFMTVFDGMAGWGLRSLTLMIAKHDLIPLNTRMSPWKDRLKESDFLQLKITAILQLRGLKHFSLQPTPSAFALTAEQEACLDDNIRRLESLIRSKVLQPRTVPRKTEYGHSTPLYPGSFIGAANSKPWRPSGSFVNFGSSPSIFSASQEYRPLHR